ncbi:hypothetical protein RHGRI_000679 [Rhododendron griersonianum]|uniref:Uncharacterized protein n=1 Tax=Rhododendron griersonianum TaxID=479676 RepID=A0AAV6LIN2_9ERIC|nr:hypothetical protein RHGRI_000679 [Rhododendron griersonianum]
MASPSDSSNQQAAMRRQNRGIQYKFLVPLIYAPVLPLIRIQLRRNPVLRDRLFTAVLAGALAHGIYLVQTFVAPTFTGSVGFECESSYSNRDGGCPDSKEIFCNFCNWYL